MKITMLSTDYKPNIGGVAQHIYELARALAAVGDEVEVISPAFSPAIINFFRTPYLEREDGFSVWRIPLCLNRCIKFVTGQITGRISKRRYTAECIKRFSTSRPDVLHWHALDTFGYPPESFCGPRVWTNHTSNFIEGIKTSSGLHHYQREASSADRVICPSQELADLTVGIGIPSDRVIFIPNGVDSKRFHPGVDSTSWIKKLNLAPSEKLILCPRRLEKKNGVRYFIEAAVQLLNSGYKDLVFAVAGNFSGPKLDSDEDVVARIISESGHQNAFRLLGRVENSQIPGLYAAATLVVIPSLIEATSLSAMEAMATGKAVVSTNVGGLPFLVRDGETGVLVEPASSSALSQAIAHLINNSATMRQYGLAARQRVESELDWSAIAKQTRTCYSSVIEKHLIK